MSSKKNVSPKRKRLKPTSKRAPLHAKSKTNPARAIKLELKALETFQKKIDKANKSFAVRQYDAIYRNDNKEAIAVEVKYFSQTTKHHIAQSKEFETRYRNFLAHACSHLDIPVSLPKGAVRLFVSSAVNEELRKLDFEQLKSFLLKFSERLPTADELVDGAETLRKSMISISNHSDALDIVGTGGDGHNTFNISTATAFAVSATGVKVAKHGNRSASSLSGAADVLEQLGVDLSMDKDRASKALNELRVSFLFAQTYHQVLKNASELRKSIGRRTIFNLLGPLANPTKPKKTLLGVYKRDLMRPMAEAMVKLGSKEVWVVHGRDGLDEVTTTDATYILRYKNGEYHEEVLTPQKVGIRQSKLADLRGGDSSQNAKAMLELFKGEKGAFHDAVLMNAGVALAAAGRANDVKTGIEMAEESIGSGRARNLLVDFAKFSRTGKRK